MKTILIAVGVIFLLGIIMWIIDIIKGIRLKIKVYRLHPHLKHLPDYFPYYNNDVKCGIMELDEGFNQMSDCERIECMGKGFRVGKIMVAHNKLYIDGQEWAENIRFKKESEDTYISECDGEFCMMFSPDSVFLYYPLAPKGKTLFIMLDYEKYKEYKERKGKRDLNRMISKKKI